MKKITAKECRFAVHIPTYHPDRPDVHMVKEILHYDDGTLVPNITFIKDYKRPFYVTKPQYRNHKENKEYETITKLIGYKTTQSEMVNKLKQLLDRSWSNDRLSQLAASPYVYGTDVTSTSFIKHDYRVLYPNAVSLYDVAVLDIETDVINGTGDIIIISIVMETKVICAVVQSFVSGFARPIDDINASIKKYISEYTSNKEIEIVIASDQAKAIEVVFKRAHEWKPDWMAIWNIDFDLPIITDTLKRFNVDVTDVMSDPKVPKSYRIFKYTQGTKKKVTSSGKVSAINPALQWHTVKSTSSFTFIDAMCVYKQLRMMEPEESSYSLDSILDKELNIGKLKFKEVSMYSGLKLHQVMQARYKIEYIVYNIFDCISMLELDKKTKDLAISLPMFSGITDFAKFKSQPKRILDALYLYLKDKKYILSGGIIPDSEKNQTLGLDDWILTLPSHLSSLGLPLIEDDANIHTNIRTHVMDCDAVSAYPSATAGLNVSKSTTVNELHNIKGIPKQTFTLNNIDLLLGKTNSITYSTGMFNMLKPTELI